MAPSQKRDYYEVLGVSRDADSNALKTAFRKMAMAHHPDLDYRKIRSVGLVLPTGEDWRSLADA